MSTTDDSPPTKISLSHYLVYAIYRTFEFALKLISMKLVCLVGQGLGHLAYMVMSGRRQVVTRNLRIAFGEKMSLEEIEKLTKNTFHHSGANLIGSIRTSGFSEAQLRHHVDVEGARYLDQAKKTGTGVICLLSHMGNWELLAQAHLLMPGLIPPATLYRPIDNPLIDQLIKRRRGSEGTQLFSRRDGFFKPIAHVKAKGSLGVLADQHAGAHGIAVPLFGKLTSMTNLPAILHRRTGAAILPLSVATTSLGKWKITVHPPIDIPADKKTNTQHITSLCADAYESMMQANPADVLWMHGYWKTGRRGPLKIDGLQKKKSITSTPSNLPEKPFRVIVYTGDSTSDSEEMIEQIQKLKNYRRDIDLTTAGQHRITHESDHHIDTPPNLTKDQFIHTFSQHDQSLLAPVDCVLDFTPEGSGADRFKLAGFTHVFTMHGKHQSLRTKKHFATLTQTNLSDFLISLGIED